MKKLIKLFCPGAKTLAGYAAKGIAKSVNSSRSETREKVATLAKYGEQVTAIAGRLATMVNDGTIDDVEQKDLAALLEPVFLKSLEYAFNW